MLTTEQFIAEIDAFLERSGMSPTAFGREVANDPNLIGDLRSGRQPNLRLVGKVSEYIQSKEPGCTSEPERATP